MPATAASPVLPPPCAPVSDHAWGWAPPSVAQEDTLASVAADHSVFDVLNLFRAWWFLNRDHLLSLVVFAQKANDGNNISWVKFAPQTHSHLVHQAITLAPTLYPLALLKRVMFTFLLEVVNDRGHMGLASFVKTSAPCCCHVSLAGPGPSTLPAPPSQGAGLVRDSRPPTLVLSSLALSLQAAPAMAVDSLSPPPSDHSPLSHMPTPCALEFNVTAVEPPSTPEPSRSSSPSPLSDTKGMSATPQVKLGRSRHGKPGTGCCTKCLRAPFFPTSAQDAASLLVPLGRPGQWYTLNSLVTYKAALRDLWVCARISIKEEECTFTETASLTSTPHVSPTPPLTPDFHQPAVPLVLMPHLGIDPRPLACNTASPSGRRSPLLGLTAPSFQLLFEWAAGWLWSCVLGTEHPTGLR